MTFTAHIRGFVSRRRLSRLLLVTVAAVSVSSSFLPRTALAAPGTISDIQGKDAGPAQEFFGTKGDQSLDTGHYATIGGADPKSSHDLSPDSLGVVICKKDAPTPCRKDSPGATTFMLDHAKKLERKDGNRDSYEFIFSPVVNGQRVNKDLFFAFRTTPPPDNHRSSALVYPATNDGFDITSNVVAKLDGFNDSQLANYLATKASADGVKWANVTNSSDTKQTSDLGTYLNSGSDDPFAKAVAKIDEVLGDFTKSLVAALSWAMDVGSLDNIKGLTAGWKVIRDLVNILFVLVLIAIALMTMLRIDPNKYSVRALLPLLIFAVIGVNFSLLFAVIMTDSATVVAHPFMAAAHSLIEKATSAQSTGGDTFGQAVVIMIAALIMVFALIVLLFFFIARIIIIWLLAVLSPFVFLAMVLPLLRGEAKKLLRTWVQWVYMAPIAFVVLFLGAEVAFTPVGVSDPGGAAILKAIFYAGVVLAAIAIPISMGGGIARALSQQGKRGGKMGGKLGLGAAGLLPAGGGKTLGARARTGKAFFEGRKASLQQDAAYDAAGMRLTMAQSPLGRNLAGLSEGQRVALQEQMVAQQEKDLAPLGTPANMRIAQAWQYGTGTDAAGNVLALNETGQMMDGAGGRNRMELTDQEQRLARNRFAAAAAHKQLASIDLSEAHMLQPAPRTGRSFAEFGYQKHHKGDPRIGAVELNGTLNRGAMVAKAVHMGPEDLKGLDGDFLADALGGDRDAITILRNIDGSRLGHAVNAEHRDKFSSGAKMDRTFEIAQQRLLSRGLTGAEAREQRAKEDVIIANYNAGQHRLRNP